VEHYTKTGEEVTKENFKEIKKLYVAVEEDEPLALVASIMD